MCWPESQARSIVLSDMDHFYAVIMAGGGGTRLWPLSRRDRPKQTLELFGQRSLFQIAVDRVLPLIPAERLRVVTVEKQLDLLRAQAPDLPAACFVREPAPRGTAAVVGLAAAMLYHEDPDAVMAVLTADHFIADEDLFRRLLGAAHQTAQQGHLVTLGIKPTEASTGYGYLHQGDLISSADGFDVFEVQSFREKPDQETAERFVSSGEYVWNSGMFVWRCGRILEEIETHMPELSEALTDIRAALGSNSAQKTIEKRWSQLQSKTIDYGVMEKADDVVLLPAEGLGWWDVGSWDRLFQLLESDDQDNIILASDTVILDSRGTLVACDGDRERLIALLGVEDLIVVDTGKALLVAKRERAEQVRSIVKHLKANEMDRYL